MPFMDKQGLAIIFVAFILDCVFGEALGNVHFVVALGFLIHALEVLSRKICSKPLPLFLAGLVITFVVCGVAFFASFAFFLLLERVGTAFVIGAKIFLAYECIAYKGLLDASYKVQRLLQENNIVQARIALKSLVGRDTFKLDRKEIIKAVVESLAENTTDAIVCPLFFLAIGGVSFCVLYKAISTLDSMIGYKDSRYKDFGHFAARLDDVAAFIPSRLAAFCMIFASFLTRLDAKSSFISWKKYRHCHESPNSAQTQSVVAGALHIRLLGPCYYQGVRENALYIGDYDSKIELCDIARVQRLLSVSAWLFLVFALVMHGIICKFLCNAL